MKWKAADRNTMYLEKSFASLHSSASSAKVGSIYHITKTSSLIKRNLAEDLLYL